MSQKILIVDDDRYIHELYEEVLREAGFEVTTATNGEDGLKMILADGYDLVLLDIMMPKLDGLGVLEKIAEMPNRPSTPIVLLTNLANDPNVIEAMNKTLAKSYLVKSDLTPDEFLEKVRGFLSH